MTDQLVTPNELHEFLKRIEETCDHYMDMLHHEAEDPPPDEIINAVMGWEYYLREWFYKLHAVGMVFSFGTQTGGYTSPAAMAWHLRKEVLESQAEEGRFFHFNGFVRLDLDPD